MDRAKAILSKKYYNKKQPIMTKVQRLGYQLAAEVRFNGTVESELLELIQLNYSLASSPMSPDHASKHNWTITLTNY
jgi:hypothetical protein